MINVKTVREIELMRIAGRIVAETFEKLNEVIKPGITTMELDTLAEEFIRKSGALPAFKGYYGFPGSICASINKVVVHGIPGPTVLNDGDIIGVDIGSIYDGYFGDAARTFVVGNVTEEAQRLVRVTEESFFEGIKFAREGLRLSDISHAIQKHVEANGFSIVRDYVGHGIGKVMHEDLQIPNYGPPNRGPRLVEGMTLAIEPMVNQGTWKVKVLKDGWTVETLDDLLSAHYENTILITKGDPEILTRI